MAEGTRRVTYKCRKCGAEDHPLFFSHEAIPPVANCWKCGAGRNEPRIDVCLNHGIGMFPIDKTAATSNVGAN